MMTLNQDQIDQAAKAMWSVYVKNLRKHLPTDVTEPTWEGTEAEDRIVFRAMALRAFKEFREIGLTLNS
jgi:hypothetical protein